MIVSFGLLTSNGVAQPLFHDQITAALPVPQVGVDPIVTVANTAIYQVGFRFLLDAGNPALQDSLKVTTILSSTTMQCSYEGANPHAHAANAVIALAISAAEIVVEPIDGGSGSIVLGSDNTVTPTLGGSAFYKIAEVAAGQQSNVYRMTNSANYNAIGTDNVWIVSSATDTYLAHAVVI